jgi:hypothetical protein
MIVERLKHPLVLVLVFAAVLGLIYVGWNEHERGLAQQQATSFFGAPATGPVSGLFHSDPKTPPPPQ